MSDTRGPANRLTAAQFIDRTVNKYLVTHQSVPEYFVRDLVKFVYDELHDENYGVAFPDACEPVTPEPGVEHDTLVVRAIGGWWMVKCSAGCVFTGKYGKDEADRVARMHNVIADRPRRRVKS